MKKLLLLVFSVITSIIFGCSESFEDDMFVVSNEVNPIENSSHFVTLKDIQTLTNAKGPLTRSSVATEENIICYTDAEQDTLLYICNKADGGWTIYSSDTRVPAIVAECAKGSFAKASENEALMAWVATIAEDMKVIRRTSDSGLNFTEEEIATNKEFWESINNVEKIIKRKQARLKRIGPHDPLMPIDDYRLYGHYELQGVYNYERVYDSIPRLTNTNWYQSWPYNKYCPQKSTGYGNAPAGCAVIAIAQMLYFLHYHLGVPQSAPSEAYCNSTVEDYPNYDWDQYNYTSTVWYYMDSVAYYGNYGHYAAPFIANIGKLSNIEYGDDGSSVTNNNLANAFPAYGITCDYTTYNENDVKSNLLNDMPVLLSASSGTVGHAFITDRYKRSHIVIETVYRWIYDETPTLPDGTLMLLPCISDSIIYNYSTPYISRIGMNWGWGSYYNDDSEWFTLTGDWICQRDPYHDNWNMNRRMIYNFRVVN